jgi:hypothetical protein
MAAAEAEPFGSYGSAALVDYEQDEAGDGGEEPPRDIGEPVAKLEVVSEEHDGELPELPEAEAAPDTSRAVDLESGGTPAHAPTSHHIQQPAPGLGMSQSEVLVPGAHQTGDNQLRHIQSEGLLRPPPPESAESAAPGSPPSESGDMAMSVSSDGDAVASPSESQMPAPESSRGGSRGGDGGFLSPSGRPSSRGGIVSTLSAALPGASRRVAPDEGAAAAAFEGSGHSQALYSGLSPRLPSKVPNVERWMAWPTLSGPTTTAHFVSHSASANCQLLPTSS